MADDACFSAERIGAGRVVLVVGPSGAGKDPVLQDVRNRLTGDARFVFPRRTVTRMSDASEDHDTVSEDAFSDLLRGGAFALHWQAHGLSYGISSNMDDDVRRGRTVVFNASRQVVSRARSLYVCSVVLIDAPAQIRRQRLMERNRERAQDVTFRLERVVNGFEARDADLTVDNSGSLSHAAEVLTDWLKASRQEAR